MNETTERFLREIAERVGRDRVAEVYLFPVMRQGASEASVAVVAARQDDDAPGTRHVLYTATYRHTVKGTDRGKWAVEVTAVGSAPLLTIEEVVRGVVRRSAEPFQPEQMSGDQFRAIVPAPPTPESAPA